MTKCWRPKGAGALFVVGVLAPIAVLIWTMTIIVWLYVAYCVFVAIGQSIAG